MRVIQVPFVYAQNKTWWHRAQTGQRTCSRFRSAGYRRHFHRRAIAAQSPRRTLDWHLTVVSFGRQLIPHKVGVEPKVKQLFL